jgi:hypothetical protein
MLPENFDSQRYYYLNKELLDTLAFCGEDRDKFLKNHYLDEGQQLGLKYSFIVPQDFTIKCLIKFNQDLKYLDVSRFNYDTASNVNNIEAYTFCVMDSGRIYDLILPEDFCADAYRKYNPDLSAMSDMAVSIHYAKHGKTEGRIYRVSLPEDFNTEEYVYLNPDLLGMPTGELERHYYLHGIYEKRAYRDALFDKDYFIKTNNVVNYTGYSDYLKDIRQIKSFFVAEQVSNIERSKTDILLVSHETSLFGATHYLYSLYKYIKDNYPEKKIKIAEKKPNTFLLEKYGLNTAEVVYYYNDSTLLHHICDTLSPAVILVNSTNTVVDTIIPYMRPETRIVRHSHEVKKHFEEAHKNTIPDYVVSLKISKEWGGLPKIQPPFIDNATRKVIDEECEVECLVVKNSSGHLDVNKVTIGMCGHLSTRKNPSLFVKLAELFKQYNFLWVGGEEDITSEVVPNLYHVKNTNLPYKYFKIFDYLLLTSIIDPCPYVVLENLYLNNRVIAFRDNIYTDHKCVQLENLYFEYPGEISLNTAVEAVELYVQSKNTDRVKEVGKNHILENFSKPLESFIQQLL